MADPRRIADLAFGPPGQLTTIPKDDGGGHQIITRRLLSDGPHFSQTGPMTELFPASRSSTPEASSHLFLERKAQMKWLRGNHQEAFMGLSTVEGVLKEEMRQAEDTHSGKSLLAVGEITDVSDYHATRGVRALVTAAGETGSALRMVRLRDSGWKWDEASDILRLSNIDPEDTEDEVLWANDAVPISKIQFATSLASFQTTRWLVVQKETTTTILQPEYHDVPVSHIARADETSSRILPNPVLTISSLDTSGTSHAEFAFNPRSSGEPPQIIIMDTAGEWTAWNIPGKWQLGHHTLRLSLYKHGSMRQTPGPVPLRHGLLPVGRSEMEEFLPSSQDDERIDVPSRSRLFLLWTSGQLDMLDMDTDDVLPHVANLAAPWEKPDPILDVQLSPVNRDHVFVLSSRFVFWVDIRSQSRGSLGLPIPKVIMSCSNLISSEHARLAICAGSYMSREEVLVLVFEPRGMMRAFWFTTEKDIPQWHTQEVFLRHHDTGFRIRSIDIEPTRLTATKPPSHSWVHFFQCHILGEDLSLRHCIFSARNGSMPHITLPKMQVESESKRERFAIKRRRKRLLAHMGDAFVLSDDEPGLASAGSVREVPDIPKRIPQHLLRRLLPMRPLTLEPLEPLLSFPTALSAMRGIVGEVTATESVPLMTWAEAIAQAERTPDDMLEDVDVSDVLDLASNSLVMPPLDTSNSDHDAQPGLGYWREKLARDLLVSTTTPSREQHQSQMIDILATDMFLGSWGLVKQDTPIFGEKPGPTDSQSTPKTVMEASRPSRSSTPAETDLASQRLRLLAPNFQTKTSKQAKVLSYWPSERGSNPDEYVSTVARATDSQFDEAREKLQKREAKKQALREKFKRPTFRPRPSVGFNVQSSPTQPGPSSSQVVPSSQSQGPTITASQPVAGAFADRKKKKKNLKPKKRAGFK